MVNRQTMKALCTRVKTGTRTMADGTAVLQKIHDEFAKFENTMEELCLLKRVAADLRSYRRMIKLKRYD